MNHDKRLGYRDCILNTSDGFCQLVMTKKSSKCSERMILYTLRKFKTRRDQFQDSVEGNSFFFFKTLSNYTAIFVKAEEFSSIICMTLVLL